jgi:hypothetical protein
VAGKLTTGESVALKIMRRPPAGGGGWQPVYLAGTVPEAQ